MATITYPTTGRAFLQVQWEEGLEFDIQANRARAGNTTTRELPGARWMATLGVPEDSVPFLRERRQLDALLTRLRGGANRLSMYNPALPAPLGGLTGTVVTSGAVGVGANTVTLTGITGGALWRGDLFAFGGQRFMVALDATPSGGSATVTFEPPHRFGASNGAAVTLDRPRTTFMLDTRRVPFNWQGSRLGAYSVPLIETW